MKTLISIIIIIGLVAVAGPVIVGIKSFDGTVTENPYEKGLRWDEIEKQKKQLGWDVHIREGQFRPGNNDLTINVYNKHGKALEGSSISVMTGRSETAEYDKYYDAVKLEEGLYRVMVNLPVYGYWDVSIEVTQDKNNLSFKRRIFIEKGA